MMLMMLGAVRL